MCTQHPESTYAFHLEGKKSHLIQPLRFPRSPGDSGATPRVLTPIGQVGGGHNGGKVEMGGL